MGIQRYEYMYTVQINSIHIIIQWCMFSSLEDKIFEKKIKNRCFLGVKINIVSSKSVVGIKIT